MLPMNNFNIIDGSSKLNILLVPGLFSPRWMLRPMGAYLGKRFTSTQVWDHPNWIGDVDENLTALENHWRGLNPKLPLAVISHSFGDWIVRELMSRSGVRRPTHLVSLAPVVKSNLASQWIGKWVGDRCGELAVMRDAERASQNLTVPASVRHLVMWPKFDPWIQKGHYQSPQTIDETIWATHNSAPMQPGVMRRVEQFLRCQTATRTRSEASIESIYLRSHAAATSRAAADSSVLEQTVA